MRRTKISYQFNGTLDLWAPAAAVVLNHLNHLQYSGAVNSSHPGAGQPLQHEDLDIPPAEVGHHQRYTLSPAQAN
jgi:hypothetical protein